MTEIRGFMALSVKCPKCGSTRVQLSSERSKHGCLFAILFGVFYVAWILAKWIIGILIFIFYDWWVAIIQRDNDKGHVWQSKKWFANSKRIYYCHDCGFNFRA